MRVTWSLDLEYHCTQDPHQIKWNYIGTGFCAEKVIKSPRARSCGYPFKKRPIHFAFAQKEQLIFRTPRVSLSRWRTRTALYGGHRFRKGRYRHGKSANARLRPMWRKEATCDWPHGTPGVLGSCPVRSTGRCSGSPGAHKLPSQSN